MLLDRNNQNLTLNELIMKFLFKYRNTPSTSTGHKPSEIIFQFTPNSQVELLKPKQVKEEGKIR